MNPATVTELLAGLTMLKFFPSDPEARAALVLMVGKMCSSEDQVAWLVQRVLDLYNEWPGPLEMRACLCSRFKPRDDISAYSAVYPDGIPISKEGRAKQINGSELLALPPGHVASVDPELDQMVTKLVEAKSMPRAVPVDDRFSRALAETITAPPDRPLPPVPTNPNFTPVTQADVDRELYKLRAAKSAVLHGLDD